MIKRVIKRIFNVSFSFSYRIHVFQMPDIAHIEYHWLNEHRINAQIQDENQLNEVLGKLNPQNTT